MASFHHRIKSGKKGAAVEHSSYISRQGRHAGREDLVDAGSGNLPDWAAQDPLVFWQAADDYERENGASYREHEIALPGELSLEQQRELVLALVRDLVGSRAFQYAIHAPQAALGDGANAHVHLMYSDRMPDGVERPAEQMFRRYRPDAPGKGGCKKATGGRNRMELRDELIETRRKCAQLQNEMLAKHGHAGRVDHRSFKQRGIKRRAERHLGPARIRRMTVQERIDYAAERGIDQPVHG